MVLTTQEAKTVFGRMAVVNALNLPNFRALVAEVERHGRDEFNAWAPGFIEHLVDEDLELWAEAWILLTKIHRAMWREVG